MKTEVQVSDADMHWHRFQYIKMVEVADFCNAIKPCCITHLYVLDFIYQNQYWAFNAKHAAMPWPTQRDIAGKEAALLPQEYIYFAQA